jgi:hypothetical protein
VDFIILDMLMISEEQVKRNHRAVMKEFARISNSWDVYDGYHKQYAMERFRMAFFNCVCRKCNLFSTTTSIDRGIGGFHRRGTKSGKKHKELCTKCDNKIMDSMFDQIGKPQRVSNQTRKRQLQEQHTKQAKAYVKNYFKIFKDT